MKVAARAHVPPFAVMEILAAANARRAAGENVLNLCAGEPSTGASDVVRNRAIELLTAGDLGYTESLGAPGLRAAIARHYADWYGVDLDPGRVAVTTGSSGGFMLAFLAALDEPVEGLVIASPANPTGTMIDAGELAALAQWCGENGVRLVSDEIYHGITYGSSSVPTAAHYLDSGAIVVNSFSKYWAMTGWRLGWLVLPDDLVAAVDALAGNVALCPPALAQHAGVAAFSEAGYAAARDNVDRYAASRALLLERLPELGWTRIAPADGAFYLYADISASGLDSVTWCARLLDEAGVALTPGTDFDPVDGHRWVRLSFASSVDVVREAVDRIVRWQGTLGSPSGT